MGKARWVAAAWGGKGWEHTGFERAAVMSAACLGDCDRQLTVWGLNVGRLSYQEGRNILGDGPGMDWSL